MLYQQGAHNGSNMGTRMHSYPIYQDFQKRAEPLAEVLCRRLVAGLGQHRQPDRARRGRDGLRQLLLDARREAGARPGVQLAGRRPGLPGPPGRRAQLRLLGQPVRARPGRRRQEDPRQRLPDDDRRRVGGGVRRPRSGAVAADSRAGADEAGDGARVGLAAHGRSPRALGPGVRAAEAGLHGRIGGRRRCRGCSRRSAPTR